MFELIPDHCFKFRGTCHWASYMVSPNIMLAPRWAIVAPWATCFVSEWTFSKHSFRNTIRVSQLWTRSGSTFCPSWSESKLLAKGNQQTTLNRQRATVFLTHISLMFFLWDIGKQCRLRSDTAECSVWSGSPLFAYRMFYLFNKILIKWKVPPNIP